MCTLLFYIISISIFCISQESLSLIESDLNQQICDIRKSLVFEKQRHCRLNV